MLSLVINLVKYVIHHSVYLTVVMVSFVMLKSSHVQTVMNCNQVLTCLFVFTSLKNVKSRSEIRWLVVTVTKGLFLVLFLLKTCLTFQTVHQLTSCWTLLGCHHVWILVRLWNFTLVWLLVTWVSTSQHQSLMGQAQKISGILFVKLVWIVMLRQSFTMDVQENHLITVCQLVSCTWSNFTTWLMINFTLVR